MFWNRCVPALSPLCGFVESAAHMLLHCPKTDTLLATKDIRCTLDFLKAAGKLDKE
jgi:hypothetical protein